MIGERPATRSSRGRGRAPDDPDEREKQLKAQLKAMSMYASHTSGDGNCLFRALSDQLYGFPSHYAILRQEICDYLEAAPERFAGFVDIEKPFDEYIRTMRQSGTYGGHLELSAFASLRKKEIKIVQPGLVYVVTGDDDSREAVAERLALEERRKRIQDRIPPGTEGPPPSARDARRRKRLVKRSRSRGVDAAVNGSARAGSSRLTAEPEGIADECDEDGDDLQHLIGPVEAFGPLYIAYHNWEHYSSIRNLTGPHTGLPRIIERNVSLAAQQQTVTSSSPRRGPRDDNEVGHNPKPTECEELILRSVPGHTLSEVRLLLKQHGNLWETVVEVLIAKDAAEAEMDGGEGRSVASSPPGTQTRSRGTSYSTGYINASTYLHGYRRDGQPASPSSDGRTGAASPPLLSSSSKKLHGRTASAPARPSDAPSATLTRGFVIDGAGAGVEASRSTSSNGSLAQASRKTPLVPSPRLDRIGVLQSIGTPSTSVSASSSPAPGVVSSSYPLSHSSSGHSFGKKRPAAIEAISLLNDDSAIERWSPRPRHTASSDTAGQEVAEEEEEEKMIVDGALAAQSVAQTKTSSGHEGSNGTYVNSASSSNTGLASAAVPSIKSEGTQLSVTPIELGHNDTNRLAPVAYASSSSTSIAADTTTVPGFSSTGAMLVGSVATVGGGPEEVTSTNSSSSSSSRSSLAPTSVSTPLSTTAPPSNVVEVVSPLDADGEYEEEDDFDVSSLATVPSKTYTYSLQTSRNRLLSPPVSPRLLAARREEGNLSAREKREIELKRKRDRQRERRAQAKRGKAGKSTAAAAAVGGVGRGGGGGMGAQDDSGSEWEPGMSTSMTSARKSKSRGGAKASKNRGGGGKVTKSAGGGGGGGGLAGTPRGAGGGGEQQPSRARKRRAAAEEEYGLEVPSSGFVELKI